jgi:hypothetical protein
MLTGRWEVRYRSTAQLINSLVKRLFPAEIKQRANDKNLTEKPHTFD